MASYFHFYRWLVGTYIFIASLSLVWIVFHILKQVNQGRSTIFSATLIGEKENVSTCARRCTSEGIECDCLTSRGWAALSCEYFCATSNRAVNQPDAHI